MDDGQTRTPVANLAALAIERCAVLGERPAVIDAEAGITLSYSDLLADARRVAAGLVAAGIQQGDRIALWAPNSARWIAAALGLWQAGAVLVPINTRFKGAEAADIIDRADVAALFTVTDFLGTDYVTMLDAALADSAGERQRPPTIVIDGPLRDGTRSWGELVAAGDDALDNGAAVTLDQRLAAVGPDDPADILFTSGTTGRSKGVVHTHDRTMQVASDWVSMTGLRAGDRYLMVNPYFHMFGLKAGILAALTAGATMYPESTFDVERVLRRVADEAITVLPGAPTIYQAILDAEGRDTYDLSSLRVAVTGAADIPVELIRRILDELPFSVVVTGYGLTEAGTATATSTDDDAEAIATTVGRPRPGFELRIVDPDGVDVAVGDAGEILLRGASVMSHYLDDPKATAAALSPDGWLSTGDLGLLDVDGRVHIVGRLKDMFIVGGFNAYPAEIENVLLAHEDIEQVAVIGVPDERLGEVGMAFVVLRPGSPMSRSSTGEADLIAWGRERLANYKVPRRIEFVAGLPINATGKVVKDELRTLVRTM